MAPLTMIVHIARARALPHHPDSRTRQGRRTQTIEIIMKPTAGGQATAEMGPRRQVIMMTTTAVIHTALDHLRATSPFAQISPLASWTSHHHPTITEDKSGEEIAEKVEAEVVEADHAGNLHLIPLNALSFQARPQIFPRSG
jgi:hypothetical protein